MLPGLKLAWDMIQALVEVGRANAWRAWDLLSFPVWFSVILIIVVPGWILATLRRSVVIDPGQRLVRQVNDFVIYRWSSTRPLDDFVAVRLSDPPPSANRKAIVTHRVELIGRNGQHLIVQMEDDEDRARGAGTEVSLVTGLPVRDEIGRRIDDQDD
jgi:hypothetical protein